MLNQKEYIKQWRKNNKEYCREYHKQWLKDNPEYNPEYNENYYQKNKDRRKKQIKEWKENNPKKNSIYCKKYRENNLKEILKYHRKYIRIWLKTENGKAYCQRYNIKRRAKEREIINTLTSQEWLDILKEYDYKCAYCGVEFNENILPTKDHIIPISKGGNNIKENIVPACQSCNSRKWNKILLRRRRYAGEE